MESKIRPKSQLVTGHGEVRTVNWWKTSLPNRNYARGREKYDCSTSLYYQTFGVLGQMKQGGGAKVVRGNVILWFPPFSTESQLGRFSYLLINWTTFVQIV